MTRIRQAIRERTTRAQFHRLPKVVIAEVNSRVRGWVQYFHVGNCPPDFHKLRRYVADRDRNFLRRRRGRKPWVYDG